MSDQLILDIILNGELGTKLKSLNEGEKVKLEDEERKQLLEGQIFRALMEKFPNIDFYELLAHNIKLSRMAVKYAGSLVKFEALIQGEEVGLAKIQVGYYKCTFCGTALEVKIELEGEPIVCPNCKRKSLKIDNEKSKWVDYSNIYLRELPRNIEAGTSEDYAALQSKSWDAVYCGISPNARIVVVYAMVRLKPHNKKNFKEGGDLFFDAEKIVPLEDEAQYIKIASAEHAQFRTIFGNDETIRAIIQKQIAPDVVGRDFAKEGHNLVLHSPLEYKNPFTGSMMRGAIHEVLYGDSKTSKSEQEKDISFAHYNLGEYVVAETSSRAGFVYAVDNDKRVIYWGKLPLNDRGLVLIDGMQKLTEEEMGQFREVLAQGRIKVAKSVSGERACRLRLIAALNPSKEMENYLFKIEGLKDTHVFANSPDLTRWDIFVPFRTNDVDAERYISSVNQERPIDSDVYRRHVLWAWSLKPEDILIGKETKAAIIENAIEMKSYISSDFPMIHAGLREQITRIAVAYAAFRHSVNETFQLVVLKEHVAMAADFITRMVEINQYYSYISGLRERDELLPEEVKEIDVSINDKFVSLMLILSKGAKSSEELGKSLGVSAQNIKQNYYPTLNEFGLIDNSKGRGVALTLKGKRYMKLSQRFDFNETTKYTSVYQYTAQMRPPLFISGPLFDDEITILKKSSIVVYRSIVERQETGQNKPDSDILLYTSHQRRNVSQNWSQPTLVEVDSTKASPQQENLPGFSTKNSTEKPPKDLKADGRCPMCGETGHMWEFKGKWMCQNCLDHMEEGDNNV
ncbi:MAG: minichromosome maintenance protein MCM [Candidatus Micrarchaeota archaeon]|nr:minichromosome maintenance protein MCM [Candidatus Micrarchaeota archaeon]